MISEGSIGNVKKGTGICHYLVKYYEEPSEYGINGGRISKLMIRKDGIVTCNYDRGWDIKPEEQDQMTQMAFYILLKNYN